MKFTVHEQGEPSRVYSGFKHPSLVYLGRKGGICTTTVNELKDSMFFVAVQVEDTYELWVVEDEMGFRELQRFYAKEMEMPEITAITMKPFTLHTGSQVETLCSCPSA